MDYIQVGKIINTHGIKGELKAIPLTDNAKRFDELKTIYIGEDKTKVSIETVWYKKKFIMLKIKGYNDINEVLQFKDKFIYIDEEDKIALPEDAYFIFDIIGCKVIEINGNEIGYVVDVMTEHSNDIYVVTDKANNKEYLIPAVKQIVKKIDILDKKIVIKPIEGLIE